MEKIKKPYFKILKVNLLILFILGLWGCDLKDKCLDEGGSWLNGIEACEKYAVDKMNKTNIDRLKVEEKFFSSEYPSPEHLLEKLIPYSVLSQHLTLLIEESRNSFIKKYRDLDLNRGKANSKNFKIQQQFYVQSLAQDFRYKQVLLGEEIFYKEDHKQRSFKNINYDIKHSRILSLDDFFKNPDEVTAKIKNFLETFINTQQKIRTPNPEIKEFKIESFKKLGIYWTLKPHQDIEILVFHLPQNPLGTELLEIEVPTEVFMEYLKPKYKFWFVKTKDKFEVIEM